MNTRTQKTHKAPLVDLHWSHLGIPHRVTAWPEACLERNENDHWEPTEAGEDELVSGHFKTGQLWSLQNQPL